MIRRFLVATLALMVVVLAVHDIPLAWNVRRAELDRLAATQERDATTIAGIAEETLQGRQDLDLSEVARRYSARTGADVIIVERTGIAVAASDPAVVLPRDYSTRPEIAAALAGSTASGERESVTAGERLRYVAVPVVSGTEIVGAVRITQSAGASEARIRRAWLAIAAAGIVSLAASAVLGWLLARSVSRPLRVLRRTTERVAAGDLDARAPVAGPPEVRALASSFNVMATRLRESSDAQRAFVADASHQLRTPLTALALRLEQARATGDRGAIDAALDETARLHRMVEGLLALARVEGAHLETVALDVGAVVAERLGVWGPLAEERGVQLTAAVAGGLSVLVPSGTLEQVIDNLVDNALEVAPEGTRIDVLAGARDASVVLHVVDQGPGMTATERARAFDRFWRAPNAPQGGTGLGLAIVRHLVTAAGGTVELRAGPGGRGIDAVVVLPRAPVPSPAGRPTAVAGR